MYFHAPSYFSFNMTPDAMTIPEESPASQTGNKLEKSLDAVAALRKAMEDRLAELKSAQRLANSVKVQAPEVAPPAPQTPADASPAPEPPKVAPKIEVTFEIKPQIAPETPRIESKAEAQAEVPKEAPSVDAPKVEAAKPMPPVGEDGKPEAEIHFDIVEWTQIMMHVSEESQKLIRDYIVRTRDKPIETVPFTPIPVMDSMMKLTAKYLENPEAYTDAQLASWQNYIDLTRATVMRMQGLKADPIAEAAPNDKRFKAKDWQTNWMFDFLKQSYLSSTDEMKRLVQSEATNVEDKLAKKLEFYSRLFLDATAPNNFWMTNPEVLRVTLESRGENLIKGLANLLNDLESGNGTLRIRMSDYRAFEVGKNIATTPGKVVFQNDLMQLIQFSPQTETVHKTPFLIIPPWINKYYILDLRKKNSFINYLVSQGHTVFCISWINPSKRHALTSFDDYMESGALAALRAIKGLTGENEANVLGYCIGGTLLASTQAYIKAAPAERTEGLPKINSATYLVTMIDFSQPGDLGVFIDEDQIKLLEERMARIGYMDANSMLMTFNLLRSNDLIWPFVINNYLLGRDPFPFDILYWNTDSTNLPAAMQSYYLRKMYLENKLIEPNALKFKGVPLDLAEIETPSFLLATREDHIAPWRSTYAATHLYKGPVTFVLAGSGHIAGVVNPPESNKYGYWLNDNLPDNPDEWLKDASEHKGSWWPQWIKWLDQYAGEQIPARQITEGIEDAPGSYVKVRSEGI